MCFGGGDAWKQDHEEILAHARGLHYDHVPGVTLPSADAPKQQWISAMDAFNAWKARERAKEASGQAWWQTYTGESGGDSGGGGGGGGGSGPPDWDNPDPPSGTGPYPDDNIYFPMLVPDYEAPEAQNWARYMPRGQQRANVRPGDIWGGSADLGRDGGLLYQPWTSTYADRFVPDNLWDYQPPELKVGRPKFYRNPLGNIEAIHPEPESSNGNNNNNNGDPGSEEGGGGNQDSTSTNVGTGVNVKGYITGADGKTYGVDHHGMVIGPSGHPSVDLTAAHNPQQNLGTTISNAVANLLGITVPTISIPEYSMEDLLGPENSSTDHDGTQPGGAPSGGHHS